MTNKATSLHICFFVIIVVVYTLWYSNHGYGFL